MSQDNKSLVAQMEPLNEYFGIAKASEKDSAKALERTLKSASALVKVREFFHSKEVYQQLLQPLAGTQLGFLTDKPNYSQPIISECATEAFLNGLFLTGNEFNIIAGKMYPAQVGKFRLITEVKGLSEFRFEINITKDSSVVECEASWLMGGKKEALKTTIHIKQNSASTVDNNYGKAKSKLFTRVLERIAGICMPEADDLNYGGSPKTVETGKDIPAEEAFSPTESIEHKEAQEEAQELTPLKDAMDKLSGLYYLGFDTGEHNEDIKRANQDGNFKEAFKIIETILIGMSAIEFDFTLAKAVIILKAKKLNEDDAMEEIRAANSTQELDRIQKIFGF